MTYDKYVEMGGRLGEIEFNELLPLVELHLDGYISNFIPKWIVKENIYEYELDNLDYILRLQLEFISSNGGVNVYMGRSDLDIKSVTTSGLTMQVGNSEQLHYYDGVPIAPIVSSLLVKELRKKGYMNLSIW